MRRWLFPLALLVSPLGCAGGVSTIMDESAYPPGRYGLYERQSGQLILMRELKPGETFGFEYTGRQPTAMEVSRLTSPADGSRVTVWRVPLRPDQYEWRAFAAATTIPSDAAISP
jgi:hypothetical protein